ncbi:hypothetical protein, conserved [Babesia bigemina]|uniref:Uncharacterized protein n=1 Tax=Babesia bigemina TaxID=5866 RepID=A0A061D9Y3_BABBI|nr:hypothetical protein, conserved [Babesia bigemina]CDR94555.1 hypothetical protein, conserved [Babesia bigemina]|eukprot:XP_012766741.1 hypothetical protein, conserved [Babesia bigemina]
MSAVSHIVRLSADVWSLNGLGGGIGGVTLRHLLRRRYDEAAAAVKRVVYPDGLHQGSVDTSQVAVTPQILPNGGYNVPILDELYRRTSSGLASVLEGLHILLWKGKQFKGCFQPSKWKWYHRHGYWATRKKLLKFDTYRRHRYHEVRGPGKRPPSKWEDKSFYKPLRDSIKFW